MFLDDDLMSHRHGSARLEYPGDALVLSVVVVAISESLILAGSNRSG